MNFFILKDKIYDALKKINNITFLNNLDNEKNIILKLKNNILYIIGNDSENELIIKIHLENNFEDGIVFISYKKLINICKSIPNKTVINFLKEKNFIILKTDKSLFHIKLYSLDKFNSYFNYDKSIYNICISKINLIFLLKSVYISIANNDVRNYLNGLYLNIYENKIISISTDSYRLSFSKINLINNINNYSFIIYKKSVLEIIKIFDNIEFLNIYIYIYSKFITFCSNNYKFTSRFLNDEFPNCNDIINKNFIHIVKIDKDYLINVIYRISSILESKNYLIILNFIKNNILISSINSNDESAKENIDIIYDGPKIQIGINYKYILDILLILEQKYILFKFNDDKSSIEINEENNLDRKYIIMPIRI
ncbi:DNA polymerase III subunit beta [endosymbiont of Euscepes postfasciatus]|uniref:DNA polymerase III subunit beta n=1 Tax=endosymbiont of Euscepes postfasciatus TaxID=650377 RepID=UPI00102F0BE6|nr:DNA polymerase III subunit beta [endosymbiont of Euscepes postfasciatus]